MKIFPAIDIIEGRAVRLFKGDYSKKTEYGSPLEIARVFKAAGAEYIHIVDLDGAKSGETPNVKLISQIAAETGMFVARRRDTLARRHKKVFRSRHSRVILGTAAVTDPILLNEAVSLYGERIAVGADVLDGKVKIKGWIDDSGLGLDEFLGGIVRSGSRRSSAPTSPETARWWVPTLIYTKI